MFSLANISPSDAAINEHNPLIRCLPYFHWQDYRAIGNNLHPLWVPYDNDFANTFLELSEALQQYDIKTFQGLIDKLLYCTSLIVRPESDYRGVKQSSLEFNCEVQRDAGQTFMMLGPLGYSDYIEDSDSALSRVLLGFEVNPVSRNWLNRLPQADKQYLDNDRLLTASRMGAWELNHTQIPNVTLYIGSFLLGGSHWMEAIDKMYQCVYCSGPVCRKWRELG